MLVFAISILILLDGALIFFVWKLFKRPTIEPSLLSELTEERRLISELTSGVREELNLAQSKCQQAVQKVTQIAIEAEQEVKQQQEKLTAGTSDLSQKIAEQFESPLREIMHQKVGLENMLRRIEQEKTIVKKLLDRGEKLSRFFDKTVPYSEIIKEIEYKKYSDARELLTKGVSAKAIASELGLTEAEVRLAVEEQ